MNKQVAAGSAAANPPPNHYRHLLAVTQSSMSREEKLFFFLNKCIWLPVLGGLSEDYGLSFGSHQEKNPCGSPLTWAADFGVCVCGGGGSCWAPDFLMSLHNTRHHPSTFAEVKAVPLHLLPWRPCASVSPRLPPPSGSGCPRINSFSHLPPALPAPGNTGAGCCLWATSPAPALGCD